MYRIGEFSQLSKTTIKTLRFYDDIDLFKPIYIDNINGYRYYSVEQLDEISKIKKLRFLELSLEEIARVLKGQNELAVLENRKNCIQSELCEKANQLDLITKEINFLKESSSMKYEANLIKVPECIAYYRQGVIKGFSGITPFVLEAGEEVRKNNPTLKCAIPEYCWVSYLDECYKDKDISIEYAEAVEKIGNESKNIKFKVVPEINAVSVFHKGPYAKISEAYAFATQFVEDNGYRISAPIRERYIDGCWNKEKEEDYLTEIQIPIEKIK